jgi:hypothetical protein
MRNIGAPFPANGRTLFPPRPRAIRRWATSQSAQRRLLGFIAGTVTIDQTMGRDQTMGTGARPASAPAAAVSQG